MQATALKSEPIPADLDDWQRLGKCGSREGSLFACPDGESLPLRRRRAAAAQAVCRQCPVRARCAAYALAGGVPDGVWGGFTEDERRRLRNLGWTDLADAEGTGVDVVGLRARLARSM